MTDNKLEQNASSGEQRYKAKRRSFLRFIVTMFAAALALGYFSGYFTAQFENGEVHIAIPLAIMALAIAVFAWFTVDYFRRIDELDLMDNLWAHLIGQYITITAFMVWYLLAELGLTEYPAAIAVIAILIVSTFAAYGLRRFGLR